jgi:hypothetical protein
MEFTYTLYIEFCLQGNVGILAYLTTLFQLRNLYELVTFFISFFLPSLLLSPLYFHNMSVYLVIVIYRATSLLRFNPLKH